MTEANRKRMLVAGGVIAVLFLLSGIFLREGEEGLEFVRWEHPTGLLRAQVPAGWKIEGELGSALELGQFKLQGYSPDGQSLFSLAHNWLSFMEFQYGPYRPGNATIESFVLPQFLQQYKEYVGVRVVYRSANRRVLLPNPMTGLGVPFDSGTLGFLLQRSDGPFSAGTAFAETMYIPSPGTPGLWRLRLFLAAVAPAEESAQQAVRSVLDRVMASLELSEEFFRLWHQAGERSAELMRAYSEQMDRVFSDYLTSVARSAARQDRALEGWAIMMRGGRWAEDETTGDKYWITNNRKYWWVNDQGVVVGNDTGEVPTYGENWRPLR